MALTSVRVKFNGEWLELRLNEATGRYEGTITPGGTSFHQPGGYFSLEAEAANETGETVTANGENMPALRLVVREVNAPTLTLVSPPDGFLQTGTPVLVFEAVDEAGGSGIDPGSFQVSAQSPPSQRGVAPPTAGTGGLNPQSSAAAADSPLTKGAFEAIDGGYRFTWSPEESWTDGAHSITASVRDNDGNEATVSGAWVVDTVPPSLYIKQPFRRHVVDDASVTVAGIVWDKTSGVEAVSVVNRDAEVGTPSTTAFGGGPPPSAEGGLAEALRESTPQSPPSQRGVAAPTALTEGFSFNVPLVIGENHILVTVRDKAGWETSEEVYMIRLVTDRLTYDVERLNQMYQRPFDSWSEEEKEWFLTAIVRGAYNDDDLNRVGVAVRFLKGKLEEYGYAPNVQPKTDWTEDDAPTATPMNTYINNVHRIRDAQGLKWLTEDWPLPNTMRQLDTVGANAIEKALVMTDTVFPRYTWWTCGEITCGEG